LESDRIGVPHRTSPIVREAVAIAVDHVDIASAQRNALLENAGTLVHHGVDTALHDLLRRDLPLHDTFLSSPLAHHGSDFGIGNLLAILVVLVPAGAGLLAI